MGEFFGAAMFAQLIWTVIYVVVGMSVFGAGFWIVTMVTPFSVRKEIEEDQNTSLGIIIGSVIIGLSIIIAAAIV
jgi:putative membrane protein